LVILAQPQQNIRAAYQNFTFVRLYEYISDAFYSIGQFIEAMHSIRSIFNMKLKDYSIMTVVHLARTETYLQNIVIKKNTNTNAQ
jgi:hypothetical protein